MRIEAAIFDLDGTILNTSEDLCLSLNYVLKKYGLPERSVDDTKRFLGYGIRRLVERGTGEERSSDLLDDMVGDFKAHYKLHCMDATRPYAGITELLKLLRERGIRTAVVSNKADFAVRELMDRFFPGLFDAAIGEREGVRRKPAPDSVNEVLKVFGIQPENAVYIGDSEVDIQTAQNAGVRCVCVAWGFRDVQTLEACGAEHIAQNVDALRSALIR